MVFWQLSEDTLPRAEWCQVLLMVDVQWGLRLDCRFGHMKFTRTWQEHYHWVAGGKANLGLSSTWFEEKNLKRNKQWQPQAVPEKWPGCSLERMAWGEQWVKRGHFSMGLVYSLEVCIYATINLKFVSSFPIPMPFIWFLFLTLRTSWTAGVWIEGAIHFSFFVSQGVFWLFSVNVIFALGLWWIPFINLVRFLFISAFKKIFNCINCLFYPLEITLFSFLMC